MSGVFWEADKQPNLCEAASGFTLSTVNLLVAIPMALVDSLVSVTMMVTSLAMVVLGPVLEYLLMGASMVMEMVGLESWSAYNTMMSLLVIGMVHNILQDGVGNKQRLFSKAVSGGNMLLWLFSFLSFSPASAKYPGLAQLCLAVQFAVMTLDIIFAEFNGYSHTPKANVMDAVVGPMKQCLQLESVMVLLVSVFGYPGFSDQDDVSQYYCLVPLVPVYMIYNSQIRPNCNTAEDNVDSVAATTNGEAVKETAAEEPAAEPASEESVKEKVAKIEEANDSTADGSSVEDVEKVDALIKRLQKVVTGVYSSVGSKVLTIISPVCNLVSKLTSMVSSLPWSCITLTITTNLSSILLAAAWFSLTNNSLCYIIPAITILMPLILNKISAIPDNYKPYIREVSGLALSTVQYCLITGVTLSIGEE